MKRHLSSIQRVLDILKDKFKNEGFQKNFNFNPEIIDKVESLHE